MEDSKKFEFTVKKGIKVSLEIRPSDEADIDDMNLEELAAYREKLKEQLEALDAEEPENEESDEYEEWTEKHEDLEDLLDDVTDRIEELEE